MLLHCLGGEGYASNCYLVTHSAQKTALLFDASVTPNEVDAILKEEGCSLSAILLTHGHYDHMLHLSELQAHFSCPVYASAEELPLLEPDAKANVAWLFGKHFAGCKAQALPAGAFAPGNIPLQVYPAPGHTKGGVFYELPGFFITGDTLLPGSCGRSDLPTGDERELRQSLAFLAEKLRQLPPSTLLCPGHGAQITAEEELARNPLLQSAAD